MKLLFDLFPVILFFIAFKLYGIYVATAVAIVASILQVAYVYAKNKRVEKMHIITLALIIILGGATLIFQDEAFIKWKPTVVNWGFALIFLGSHFIGQKPIIRRMMDQAISLPDRVWLNLSYMWIVFFIFSGIANIYVAYQYDTDTWVNFKLFGLMGLTLVFIIVQGIYISRYIKETGKQFDETEQRVMDASIETLADAELDSVSPAKSRNKPSDDSQ
ncbi:septation protein A [Hydrogenovibrio thermophilus]|jgi:intracellular septation protein|uniref:Inner membrane-spanning protein YciB n=1 Tax=Hydrogenovibrio thermophilus TaxID=265883 RepID=A0A410H397_9GAMM|nr:septation protein A [Hydrogenovibrio thermophilus]QAB15393.1 septation protein A [Hydrogenovibrio thermophilus]